MRQINHPESGCKIILTNGHSHERVKGLTSLFHELAHLYSQWVVISDLTVYSLFGPLVTEMLKSQALLYKTITLKPGEVSKSLIAATYCWEKMIDFQADRKTCVLALGGGVITDIAGFVASCYMRGIDFISIPTTLLGMVDAAIGGKTGVNLAEGKNVIGTFHCPKVIFICPTFLETLPEREYRAGLAEVIKYAVIHDPLFLDFLEKNMPSILARDREKIQLMLQRSCEIKLEIIKDDFLDNKGVRSALNWGHTFAHAIESVTGFQRFLHGEAVAIGMHCAARVSEFLGYCTNDFTKRQQALIRLAKLPVTLSDIPITKLLNSMSKDKKATCGKINLILAEKFGKVFQALDIDPSWIKQALSKKR